MRNEMYDLTEPQKRIWYTQLINPESSLYYIGGQLKMCNITEPEYVITAFRKVIEQHDAFRMRFCNVSGNAKFYYDDTADIPIDLIDLSEEADPEKAAERWMQAEIEKRMDLFDQPLYRMAVLKYAGDVYGCFLKMHHLISDGWSFQLIVEQIYGNVQKLMRGEEIITETIPYGRFMESEKQYLVSEKYKKDQEYWQKEFSQLPEDLRSFNDCLEAKRKTCYLNVELLDGVNRYCKENAINLNVFFLCVWLLCDFKMNHKNDIVMGIPVLGRSDRKERKIIGMCVSSLALRINMNTDKTILDFMEEIKGKLREMFRHQRYPLNHLVRDLKLEHEALFSSCYNYYGTDLNYDNAAATEFFNGNQDYEMQIIIRNWLGEGKLQIDIDYQTAVYEEKQIERIYDAIGVITKKILNHSDLRIKDLSLVSEDEENRLVYRYNRIGKADFAILDSVVKLIDEQTKVHGDRIAVKDKHGVITYRELTEKANYLAMQLQERGIGAVGDVVGLVMTHSIESVIGILGVLKAHAVYLPVDIACPSERMLYMFQDAHAKLVLSDLNDFSIQGYEAKNILYINRDELGRSSETVSAYPSVNDLAYIIYTSGSTGKPKAVMLSHGNLSNYIQWARQQYTGQETEVFALYSSFAFDLTVTSIFTPLISGGRINAYENDEEEYVINRILKEDECTVLKLTPSHMRLISDTYHNRNLKKMIVGGEDLTVELAKSVTDLFEHEVAIYNEYGPTEATVGCMCYIYDKEKDLSGSVPIGQPIANTQIYLLDSDYNPVPVGCRGEMYISGEGVAKGYLNCEDLTAERFVECPFVKGKMYKTGDEAIFISDTNMRYIGRIDQQMKIRGHRIELGEIESALKSIEKVKDATADIKKINGTEMLCAYYISEEELDEEVLRADLAKSLPDYMVPAFIVKIDIISLTPNGKVNRKALPIPKAGKRSTGETEALSEREYILIKAFEKVLGTENIQLSDNFFHNGGDSIKAIQLAAELRQYQYKIGIKNILKYPDLFEMSRHMEKLNEHISQAACEGIIRIPPMFQWFEKQMFERPNAYCQSIMLTIEKPLSKETYEKIQWEIIKHHDMLRLNYDDEQKVFYFNASYLETMPAVKEWFADESRAEEKRKELVEEMDISRKALIQSGICHTGDKDIWCIVIHHLAVDGVSWRILLEDFDTLIRQAAGDTKMQLPDKTVSYQQWAGRFRTEQLFIKNNPERESRKYREGRFVIDKETTVQLLTDANQKYHTKPAELMLSALLYRLQDILNKDAVCFTLEGHGREDELNITRTVGWFTVLKPVRLNILQDSLKNLINEVRCKYQFDFSQKTETEYGKDEIRVRFNFMGEYQEKYESFSVCTDVVVENELVEDIEIDIVEINKCLQVIVRAKNNISADQFEQVCRNYESNLKYITEYCGNTGETEVLPADFDSIELDQEDFSSLFE